MVIIFSKHVTKHLRNATVTNIKKIAESSMPKLRQKRKQNYVL